MLAPVLFPSHERARSARPLRRTLLASLLLAGLFFAALASATPESERRARDIAANTMSPFCPGKTLTTCPSPNATRWRGEIRSWTEQGLSTAEIRARLEARVPGEDLSGGPRSGSSRLIPVILGTVSALLLVVLFRRFRRAQRAQAEPSSPSGTSDPTKLDERLDRELHDLEDDDEQR